jgi:hypothetical protein
MSMLRFLPLLLVLTTAPLVAQSGYSNPALNGRIEGKTYLSPTGTFKVAIPVLPELGGRIVDTESAVTFQDNFNVFVTIAAFPLDAEFVETGGQAGNFTGTTGHARKETRDRVGGKRVSDLLPVGPATTNENSHGQTRSSFRQ